LPTELAALPIVLDARFPILLVFTFTLVEPHEIAKAVNAAIQAA